MKLLLDSCISPKNLERLQRLGYDVDGCSAWERDPGGLAILREAHRTGRILVTLDEDFGTLAILHGEPHCGIIRLVDIRSADIATHCDSILKRFGDELNAGALVSAGPSRIRVRLPDEQK